MNTMDLLTDGLLHLSFQVLFERYVNVFSGSSVNVINRFGDHSQQDSHEFLTYMLQSLHEDLNRPIPLSEGGGLTSLSDEEEQKLSDKVKMDPCQ